MRKLKAPKRESDLIEIDSFSPTEYEEVVGEGYFGQNSADLGDEKQLLRSLFSTLRKHWFLILSLNLFVTAVVIIYVAQKPDYYKADARVQVNAENNPAAGGGRSGANSIIVNNPGNDPVYFTTQLQILEGSGLLGRVVKTLDLEHNQAFLDPQRGRRLTIWQNVERMFGFYRPSNQVNPLEAASADKVLVKNDLNLNKQVDTDQEAERLAPSIALLKKNLSVTPVKDTRTSNKETRLIEIEYTHEDSTVAAKIVNTIADIYVLQNLEQKVQSNASAGDFLQKRVAELQSEIRLGEERLLNYSKSNQIVSLDANQNTVVQRFSDLNLKLGQAQNERIAAQTTYQAALQNQMREATAETKDSQVISLEAKLNDLRQKLAQLKTEYTDEWFEVVQTRKNIESVENQLFSLRKRASDIQQAALEEKLNEAIAREKELRDNFEKQRAEVIRQNEASVNYKIIQQEIDTNKTLLDGLLQRSRENDVILNGTPNNVLVSDRAIIPRSAAGPERTKNIAIAFISSLMLGIGLAFLLDWLNDSVRYSSDVENLLNLPMLAAIPAASVSFGNKLLPANFALTRKSKRAKRFYNLNSYDEPAFLESYLQLRTSLLLSTAGGPPKTILVASAEEGEGKTVTALNLAASLAKTGEKILLIDADLRCPRIHSIKELNNHTGLTTLLTAKNFDDGLIEKTVNQDATIKKDESIKEDVGSNLHILTSGERTINPANLLSSPEMSLLLQELATKYSHIVIDSPPILYFADTVILSTLADAVVLVVRDSISSRQTVLKAKKMLLSVGARIVGIVMNGVPLEGTNYYHYKHYESKQDLPFNQDHGILKLD